MEGFASFFMELGLQHQAFLGAGTRGIEERHAHIDDEIDVWCELCVRYGVGLRGNQTVVMVI